MRAIILCVCVLLKILTVHAQGWEPPFFNVVNDPRITKGDDEWDGSFGKVEIHFDENVEVGFTLGELLEPGSSPGTNSPDFKLVEQDGKYLLQSARLFDYENDDDKLIQFTIINAAVVGVNFYIHINNLNDNPFQITKRGPCAIEENTMIVDPPCVYELTDLDGLSEDLDLNTFDAEYAAIFEFACQDGCTGKTKANVEMKLKRELDYEDVKQYVFDWTVNDKVDYNSARVQVNVVDMPDELPVWKTIQTSNQFDEEEQKTFTFLAKDGDTGIDDEIIYTCYDLQPPLNTLLTCTPDGESLRIDVAPIDRDEEDLSTLKFMVKACETTYPDQCAPREITFIINDINDNKPEITLKSSPNIKFEEEKYVTIDLEFEIKDLDLGDYGTFFVNLKCESAPTVEAAIQVIPNVGYRTGTFSLSIVSAEILDYDRTNDLRNFEIKIEAVEKYDPSNKNEEPVQIELINWNDEEPAFTIDVYTVKVPETFGRDGVESLNIPNLIATDLDENDHVTYALIGSGINNILELESDVDPVKIRSISQSDPNLQLFDYEKQTVVRFQLEASDNFDDPANTIKHKKFAEINVELEDVNDETPLVTLTTSAIEIDENRPDGFQLPGIIVTATDADRDSILKVEIDWDGSYAIKYGQPKEIFKNEYKNSFYLLPQTNYENVKKFTVHVKDVVSQNTPNYEEFDTIYLQILVTDEAQTRPVNYNKATLIINVKDLNDNPPVFVEEVMNVPRSVKENSQESTTIGLVAAEDLDINSVLTFSLTETGSTPPDLVDVDNQNRVVVVVGSIDAEDLCYAHNIRSLTYEICVTDGDHPVCRNMEIEVKDENDEKPQFRIQPVNTAIKEHSDEGTFVLQIDAFDEDRDSPNNDILYSFEETQTSTYFDISITGEITVKTDIERDGPDGHLSFDVKVVLKDNPDNKNDQKSESSNVFRIIIEDINDEIPKIKTLEIRNREDIGVGNEFGIIEAEDLDEPGSVNAEVYFEIVELIGCYDQLDETFFRIETDAQHLSQKGTIKVVNDLKGFFTDCKIKIRTHDSGTYPKQQEDIKDVNLFIDKYNYEPPNFIFPNKPSIYLKPDQNPDQRVRLYDNNELPAIEAEHTRPEKYDITFSLADDSEGKDTFYFISPSRTTAYLSLKNGYDNTKSYKVKILAKDNGDPPLETVQDIKIGFFDTNKEPVFKEDERNIEFEMDETMEGVGATLQLPEATLDVDDENIVGELDIYYHKYEDLNKAFNVDKDTGKVTLVNPIFVLNLTSEVLKVVASKSEVNFPNDVSPGSIVTVNLKVNDINDNPPVFNQSQYSSGVMVSYEKNRVVAEVAAYDLDTNDVLTYSIVEGTYKAVGDNINANLHKFDLNSETGAITLGFEVQQNMKGYFAFEAKVSDTKFDDTTNVKIYIISDDNEVAIRFDNTFQEITDGKYEIQQILSDFLEYECSVHGISEAADENGNAMTDVTEIKIHCVDRQTNLPINKDNIKVQINTVEMIGLFRQSHFFISSVRDVIVPENMEEQLKIWLICVSVVLGSFCVLLIVAFIIKTKSLMMRISKLTTVDFADDEKRANDSSVQVPAAPNTNRRAVEGSNPIFNSNFEDNEVKDYDNKSISSDDSDFLGVENNPVFDD